MNPKNYQRVISLVLIVNVCRSCFFQPCHCRFCTITMKWNQSVPPHLIKNKSCCIIFCCFLYKNKTWVNVKCASAREIQCTRARLIAFDFMAEVLLRVISNWIFILLEINWEGRRINGLFTCFHFNFQSTKRYKHRYSYREEKAHQHSNHTNKRLMDYLTNQIDWINQFHVF